MKISISGLLVMIIQCINLLEAQKYWSCDSNCPLRCSKMEDSADNPVCCFIPDVTILSITFSSECHFNCANKCYSGGLKIHNKGLCEGKYSSSESDSRELTIVEETTTPESVFEEPEDAFSIGSATQADILVTNETSIKEENLEALEKAAVANELDSISSRKFLKRKKKKHKSEKENKPTAENINDLGEIKEIENNGIGDATPSIPNPEIITDVTKDEMEKNAESNDQKRIGKKIARITTPPTANTVTVNETIENATLFKNILDLVATASPIEASTKAKKRKKKGKKSKNYDTVSLNTTEENTSVTTGTSIVDLVNSLPIPTTVSTIEASTIPTNMKTKKHKRKKGSKLKQNATTVPPNTDQYNDTNNQHNDTTTETNNIEISPANVVEISAHNINETLFNTTGPESKTVFPIISSATFVGTIIPNTTTTTLPATIPTTLINTIPDTVPNTVPETFPKMIPETLPTTIQTTLPTTIPTMLPATNPTTLPTTIPTTLPKTIPTTLPKTIPTTLPITIPTMLPTTMPTTIPTTIPKTTPTAIPTTIPTTVPTKKKSKKKSKKSKKVVEEVDEFDKPSNDDDAWAKDIDLTAYSR